MDNPISVNIQNNLNTIPNFLSIAAQAVVTFAGAPSRIGVSGFIFDIIGVEEMMLDSEITDHYLEDNTSIQDQIALRPERFTLAGYVGEIASQAISPFTSVLTQLQSFGAPAALIAAFSPQAAQVYDGLTEISNNGQNIINQAANIYTLFSDLSTTTNKQTNAFQYFYALWQGRQLCEIETPWGIFENMAIENIRAKQDEHTRQISDFSVTFKRMRFANTTSLTSTGADLSSVTGSAYQKLQDTPISGGTISGTQVDNSLLQSTSSLNSFKGVDLGA